MGLDQERLPFHDMKLHPYGGTPTSALRASKAGPTSARWPCEDLRRDRLKTDAATRDRFQLAAPLRAQGTEIAECPVVIFPQTSWWSEARLIWTSRWDFPVPSARLPNNHISSTLSYLLVQAARSRSQSSSISSRRVMRSTRQAGRNMARKRWFLFLRFTPLPYLGPIGYAILGRPTIFGARGDGVFDRIGRTDRLRHHLLRFSRGRRTSGIHASLTFWKSRGSLASRRFANKPVWNFVPSAPLLH